MKITASIKVGLHRLRAKIRSRLESCRERTMGPRAGTTEEMTWTRSGSLRPEFKPVMTLEHLDTRPEEDMARAGEQDTMYRV